MKKKIVIVGAFDRYNYGDNLLPILFEIYLKKFAPNLLDSYELRYCAITKSNLSRYGAKPTTSLEEEVSSGNVHSFIAIGGEVLAATSSSLILHNSPSNITKSVVKFLRSNKMKRVADLLCQRKLGLPWEFPYIPKRIDEHTRIAMNAVGGIPPQNRSAIGHRLAERLINADYISVRDRRTYESVKHITHAKLYPDSAITMGSLVSSELLASKISAKVSKQIHKKYICFQAAPEKSGCTVPDCANVLKTLMEESGLELLLLPVGYASGHDDHQFLSKIHDIKFLESTLLFDLNLWEIMSLIKNSTIFIGTSLHGVITAMSFGTPYIGLNPKIVKLQSFLQDWGISPLNKCYQLNDLVKAFNMATAINHLTLQKHATQLHKLGLQNYHDLLGSMYPSTPTSSPH